MNVLICACGTGGHYFPAFVVADLLADREDDFVVVVDRPEAEAAARSVLGDRARLWRVARVGGGWLRSLQFAQQCGHAWRAIRRLQPEVALTMGGAGSLPFVIAARLSGVPVVLHEANAFPGRANRCMARWAAVTTYAIPGEHPFFQRRDAIAVGMPLRPLSKGIALSEQTEPRGLAAFLSSDEHGPAVLLTGGSQGALPLNDLIVEMLGQRPDLARRMRLVILTGPQWVDRVRHDLGALSDEVFVAGAIPDLPSWLDRFDFAICRSGSSTLWELIRARVPSLLVPFPHAADDHQRLNATWASSIGPMIEVPQQELTPLRLASILEEVIHEHPRMGHRSGRWSMQLEEFPSSPAQVLVEVMEEVRTPRRGGTAARGDRGLLRSRPCGADGGGSA